LRKGLKPLMLIIGSCMKAFVSRIGVRFNLSGLDRINGFISPHYHQSEWLR
jgi:hypothetical protein